MGQFKNLMVGLDLGNLDKTTIPYAAMVSRLIKPGQAYFIHAAPHLTIPDDLLKEYPHLLEPHDEKADHKIKESARSFFDGCPTTENYFEVVEAQPLDEMLRRIPRNEIDLILVGRKSDVRKTRLLPLNLARTAQCSVMVVPDGVKPEISKLLLPVDFSECSAEALKVAVSFAVAANISEIHCLHAYSLPLGYYKTGKSEAEFSEIMKRNAEKNFQKFIKNIDTKDITLIPSFVKDKDPANAIRQAISQNKSDLVVMGARGRSPISALLIGSVTEHVIQTTNVPVIAVKKKGANLKFLEAVFQL